jgi:hypothetical protein
MEEQNRQSKEEGMATKPKKTVKASTLKTKKQYDEAVKKGWNIVYTDGYPPARSGKGTKRK